MYKKFESDLQNFGGGFSDWSPFVDFLVWYFIGHVRVVSRRFVSFTVLEHNHEYLRKYLK